MDAQHGVNAVQISAGGKRAQHFIGGLQLEIAAPIELKESQVDLLIGVDGGIQQRRVNVVVNLDHLQHNAAAHAVPPDADMRPIRLLQRTAHARLRAHQRQQVEGVNGVAHADRIVGVLRCAVTAQVGMQHDVASFRQRIRVARGIRQGAVFGGVHIAVQYNHHRERTIAGRNVHETVQIQPLAAVFEDVARESAAVGKGALDLDDAPAKTARAERIQTVLRKGIGGGRDGRQGCGGEARVGVMVGVKVGMSVAVGMMRCTCGVGSCSRPPALQAEANNSIKKIRKHDFRDRKPVFLLSLRANMYVMIL